MTKDWNMCSKKRVTVFSFVLYEPVKLQLTWFRAFYCGLYYDFISIKSRLINKNCILFFMNWYIKYMLISSKRAYTENYGRPEENNCLILGSFLHLTIIICCLYLLTL